MAITQIRFRRGTTAEWATFNPVLAAGEPGVDTDTDRLKIGDGEKPWSDLPFQSTSPDQLNEALSQLDASLDGIDAAVAAAQAAQTAAEAAAATASNVGASSDANIAGQVNVANSLTRAALNALYGRVDRIDVRSHGAVGNGTTDDRTAIQAAMDQGVATGRVVLVPAGFRFLCSGGLYIDSKLKMQIDGVLLRGFAGLGGANGFLGNRDGQVKVNDVTIWGRGGIDLVDGTMTGNQVYLHGDRNIVSDVTVYQFSGARAWNISGDYVKLMGVGFYGPVGLAGNGGIRFYSGRGFRAVGCHGISGDDAFQFVPAGNDTVPQWNVDTVDGWFIGCHGDSLNGRVMIVTSVQNSAGQNLPDGTLGGMTAAVRDCGFIGVSGKGGQLSGVFLKNGNSSGPIENILFDGCSIDMIDSTEVTTGDVFITANSAASGLGPIRNAVFRNFHVRNPTGVSYRVHSDNVFNVKFVDCYAERSTRTPTEYVVEACGNDIKIIGGVYDGKDTTTSQVIRFATTGGTGAPVRPAVVDATIKGIGQGQNGITFTAATSPRMENVRFEAAATATTAKAFNAASTTTDLAFNRMDFTGLPGTTKFTNNATGTTLTGVNNRGYTAPASGGGASVIGAALAADATAVNNSTTFVTSTGLVVALEASSTYRITADIFYDGAAAADLKLGWSTPTGSTGKWTGDGPQTGTAGGTNTSLNRAVADITGSANVGAVGVGTTLAAKVSGTIFTSTTAGSLALRYAQAVADPTDLILRAGCTLTAVKIA